MNLHSSLTLRCGVIVLATSALFIQACGGGAPAPDQSSKAHALDDQFEIRTLSNRADLISNGDALVEVRVPNEVPLQDVALTLNGANVGAAFVSDQHARTLRGVLRGLRVGENHFAAATNGRGELVTRASLTITNHPQGGRVLMCTKAMPWVCAKHEPE